MPVQVYRNAPVAIYEDGPNALLIKERPTPAVATACMIGAPLTGFGAALVLMQSDLFMEWAVAGGLLAVIAIAFLFILLHRIDTRVTRVGATRTRRIFGVPLSHSLLYSREDLPHVEVRTVGDANLRFQSTLRSGVETIAVGPVRGSHGAALHDGGPLRQFFQTEPETIRVSTRRDGRQADVDWTQSLDSAEASGTCPMCRDDLQGTDPLVSCDACGTGYHRECAQELGSCATLGCRNRRQRHAT